MLIDWYLPGTKAGGPVRSVYSLVQLLKNNFHFCVVTSAMDLGSRKAYRNIRAGEIFEKDRVSYYYAPARTIRSAELRKVLEKFDAQLIYLNSFWSYSFSVKLLRLCRTGQVDTPVILAPRGMLGSGALHLKALKKKIFLVIARLAGLHRNVVFHATQEGEKNDIRYIFPNATIRIAPNVTSAVPRKNNVPKQTGHLRLFYLSRISKVKNLHYALEALAGIKDEIQVTYDIFGNIEDEAYWHRCQQIIKTMPPGISVKYKGELAFNEVQDTLSGYHALLLPTLNENFGHSIVESLMSGCLVIISDQTPWTDVNKTGSYAMPLDIQMDFTTAISECTRMNEVEFRRKSAAAIEYISNKTNIAHAAQQYRDLFNGSIKN